MRTLDEIEQDLHMCAEYVRMGTTQAALRAMNDIRADLLDLLQYIRALYIDNQRHEETLGQLEDRASRLEQDVERIDAGSS